jgi:hypothetical protein
MWRLGLFVVLPMGFTKPSPQSINQSINVTPVAMKLKKLMPAIH